jgi:hypothetical protein
LIGIDAKRIGLERHLLERRSRARHECARPQSGQAGHQVGVLRVQVLENDALVAAKLLGLLIVGRAVEEPDIEVLGQRARVPPRLRPPGRARAEPLHPRRPRRRDRAEPDGSDEHAPIGHEQAQALQVRHRHLAHRIGRRAVRDADGVPGVQASCGALVAERHPHERRPLAQLALGGPDSVAPHLDGFVDLAHEHSHHERARGLAAGRVGVPDQEHVGARLDRHEIRSGREGSPGIVVPVAVGFVRRLLMLGQRRDVHREAIRRLAHDDERLLRLPDQRGHPEGAQ